MRLQRLELFGFKSFLNRTVFQFDQGVTSIVGPNGCGKSNIVDAVVWVLGERGTKSLRVKDMGDVIFHGSNGRRPVNIGEVVMELNDGGRDVSVKRRIYRDGTNEYYLNNALVRLKDVQDFFLGTGVGVNSYAIVEQGRIEYFTQMRPQERRVVVEETSGITRFEEKKREAGIRLEEVTSNLERVEDIYSEVTKSFEKAETEWHRWKVYKRLADKQNEVEKWILLDGFIKLKKRMARITERQEEIDREIGLKEEEKEKLREGLKTKEEEFSLVDTTIRKLEVDIKGKEKDMESRLLEIDYLRGEHKRLENEQAGLARTRDASEKTIAAYEREIEALKVTKTEREQDLEREEAQSAEFGQTLEGHKLAVAEYEEKIEAERVRLFVVMSKVTEIKNRILEIERLARERKKQEEKRAEEKGRLTGRLGQLESTRRNLQGRIEEARAEGSRLAAEEAGFLRERQRLAQLINEERNGIESLKSEKKGKEEFLKQMASIRSDRGVEIPETKRLIDLLRTEEAGEKALERFFFRELEYHVLRGMDFNEVADKVARYEGNFIFFPPKGIFRLNADDVELNVNWIRDVGEGLRRIEGGEEGIFLNDAVYIDSRGFILREKDARKVDLKQFRERKKAEKALKEIEATLTERLAAMKKAQEDLNRCDMTHRGIKMRKDEQEKVLRSLDRELLLVEAEAKVTAGRLGELNSEVDLFEESPPESTESLAEEQRVHEAEKVRHEGAMGSLRQQLDKAKKEHEETRSKWQDGAIRIERQKNGLKALDEEAQRKLILIKGAREEKERLTVKMEETLRAVSECGAKIGELEKNYDILKGSCQKDIERYEGLKDAFGVLHMEKQALAERIETVAKESEKIRGKKEAGEREMAVLLEKRDAVCERLAGVYGIETPEEVALPQGGGFEAERERIIKEIADLGEVNFRAEKEYMELQERTVFLEQQKEDLGNAMDSLKKTIAKIDALSKDIFLETFETVNGAFKKFTQMLFKGGQGYLALNQDGGIDMYVQPPGKKVARMEQLSGGEKALISLGFLLSLMDTRPSPFSLMDEIDAPLDDANLMSLMEIMQEISRKTQVIFITHNRITMENSNAIYGITMEEEGISKVVSVRL